MFAKTATLAALFTAVAQVAALPPACLIAAVNTCPDPSDIKSICAEPSKVTSYISKNCGDNQKQAMSDFKSVCDNAGAELADSSSSTGSSTKVSATGSLTTTKTSSPSLTDAVITPTGGMLTGTGMVTYTSGMSGATGASGSGGLPAPTYGSVGGNGTLPTSAGTAGPTAGSGADSSPSPSGSDSPSSGAGAVGLNVGAVAAVGVLGAFMLL